MFESSYRSTDRQELLEMLNASHMEILSICRRNNLEEEKLHLSCWHPVDWVRRDREHGEFFSPHVDVFLAFCTPQCLELLLLQSCGGKVVASALGKVPGAQRSESC